MITEKEMIGTISLACELAKNQLYPNKVEQKEFRELCNKSLEDVLSRLRMLELAQKAMEAKYQYDLACKNAAWDSMWNFGPFVKAANAMWTTEYERQRQVSE